MTFWTDLLGQEFRVDQVDVGGVSTRSLRSGAGEAIIFLHGISGHLETFVPCIAPYDGRYNLHLIDMLGHGWTDKVDGDVTVDRLADHVTGYMDALGIEKAHLVGLSLGGWVAGWLAANAPARVLTATLVAAAGNPAMGRPEVSTAVRQMTIAGVMSNDREHTRGRLAHVLFKPDEMGEELVDVRYTVYQDPIFRAHLDGLLALTETETYKRYALTPELLARIPGEVLLVWGEDDDKSGVADADFLLEHIARSKLVQMSDTGHWPPYERPADFARLSTAFIEGGLAAITPGRC